MVCNIGGNATAAVWLTSPMIWMLNGFMNAVGVGYSVQVARHIGAGAMEQAREVIRQAVLAVLVHGSVLTVLVVFLAAPMLPHWMHADAEVAPLSTAYLRTLGMVYLFSFLLVMCSNVLRCTGDTKTPMLLNIMTNIINVAGKFFLIYPAAETSL